MAWGWAALLLVVLAAALPFAAERLRPKPSIGEMRRAPGGVAEILTGPTHFRWLGPEGAPVAVCVHGLTTPSPVFDRLAALLAQAGFRVLLYDLPGRGLSPHVRRPQDAAYFTRQLSALLGHESVDRAELLVGYSMGGAIATLFAAQEPERVGRLVLLAPTGLHVEQAGPAARVAALPLLGDWAMLAFGGAALRRGFRAEAAARPMDRDILELQLDQTRLRGFRPAVLSSQRHLLGLHLGEAHRAIAAAGLPLLALWGEEDRTIPVSNVGRLAEVNRSARQAVIEGAGHGLVHTHAEAVMAELRGFLHATGGMPWPRTPGGA